MKRCGSCSHFSWEGYWGLKRLNYRVGMCNRGQKSAGPHQPACLFYARLPRGYTARGESARARQWIEWLEQEFQSPAGQG